jgi:hypothetical protein
MFAGWEWFTTALDCVVELDGAEVEGHSFSVGKGEMWCEQATMSFGRQSGLKRG